MNNILYTKNCIVCLKEATSFSGHVMKGGKTIIVGWCDNHKDVMCPHLLNKTGCYGVWSPGYGIREEMEEIA